MHDDQILFAIFLIFTGAALLASGASALAQDTPLDAARLLARQGRTAEAARLVVEDALAVQEAGAQMILLEAIPPEVAAYITRKLDIPVLSIGAGPDCDGQLLIVSDMIGQFQAFTPKFVKKYFCKF